ncbi:MAG: dicarboxylate/amino acid:cation symporter [Candidatus Eisenbacteria bacterium]|nr:dicarboxylate/amino acid:cation symporter [Candidatus Eisenbacteria bacterium]
MAIGLLVGLVAGVAAHLTFGDAPALAGFVKYVSQPIGQIFLRLLMMLVIPLLFSALALGVAGLGDLRQLGRIGWRTLAYTVVVSAIAVAIGITLVNLVQPGAGLSEATRAKLMEGAAGRASGITSAPAPKSGIDLIVSIVPNNPIKAMAEGDMLAVMFFSLLFGIGLAMTPGESARRLEGVLEGLFEVSMRLIHLVIGFAPLGVAALLFTLTAQLGYEVLGKLLKYVLVVFFALAIHQVVVYSLAVRLFGGMSPIRFFKGIEEAMITAFSTASSNATLPTALRVAEEKLHLPPQISRFVLTIGSTANQNGTALFEGVTVLFLAQFFGVALSLSQQIMIVGICILGGIGTAGVPAGSIPVIAMILGMVHIPVEGIGLILGVDRFLDMCRTVLNVSGDLAAAVVVSHGERRSES